MNEKVVGGWMDGWSCGYRRRVANDETRNFFKGQIKKK